MDDTQYFYPYNRPFWPLLMEFYAGNGKNDFSFVELPVGVLSLWDSLNGIESFNLFHTSVTHL
jgi:hypothetical protein